MSAADKYKTKGLLYTVVYYIKLYSTKYLVFDWSMTNAQMVYRVQYSITEM